MTDENNGLPPGWTYHYSSDYGEVIRIGNLIVAERGPMDMRGPPFSPWVVNATGKARDRVRDAIKRLADFQRRQYAERNEAINRAVLGESDD